MATVTQDNVGTRKTRLGENVTQKLLTIDTGGCVKKKKKKKLYPAGLGWALKAFCSMLFYVHRDRTDS